MISWHQLYNEGRERMTAAGNEQAALVLLNELCAQKDINLYMEMENPADEEIMTDYLEGIHRMENGEPLGYVLGYEWFYGRAFDVNADVLIPRPETEELCGLVLQEYDAAFEGRPVTVFDVGTGSGAIGITLACEEPNMKVIGSDISPEALEMARHNAIKLKASVPFIEGSMLDPYIDRALHSDILVCNPPYIPQEETMEHSVVDFEPHTALFGGVDGLFFYREVLEKADQVLNPGGFMAFEMGWNQAENLTALVHHYYPQARVEVHKDLSGKDRMLCVHPDSASPAGEDK